MPDVSFWRKRFAELGQFSIATGSEKSAQELDEHKQEFRRVIRPWLEKLEGPVLDFGCGIGRWVMDLPRPYLGLDLTPEHLGVCRERYGYLTDVEFRASNELTIIPEKSYRSVFTLTVLQHIVEPDLRKNIIQQFSRVLMDDGILLSVEWADGQREFDWCKSVGKKDWKSFKFEAAGEVVEGGRRHTVWVCQKRQS